MLFGGTPVRRGDGWAHVEGVPGRPKTSFPPDPAAKTERDRLHLDAGVDDLHAATLGAEAAGAGALGGPVTDEQGSFQVLQDPEGNEFCLVTPRATG